MRVHQLHPTSTLLRMREHLEPTSMVDKNGVSRTVYRRPANSTDSASSKTPPKIKAKSRELDKDAETPKRRYKDIPDEWLVIDPEEGWEEDDEEAGIGESPMVVPVQNADMAHVEMSRLRKHDLAGLNDSWEEEELTERQDNPATQDVDVSTLTQSAQSHLYPEVLQWYMDDCSGDHPFGEEDSGYVKVAKFPEIGYVVIDGNHRVATAKMSGEKTIKAQVAHMENGKWKSSDDPDPS